jgi:hypothetical protein
MSEDWALLDFSECSSELEMKVKCWNFFNEEYIQKEVQNYDGILIRGFNQYLYQHIISGSSDYKFGDGLHDVDFVEERAEKIPWIRPSVEATDCVLEIRREQRPDSRGRRRVDSIYLIVDRYYVVVLEDDASQLRIRTAYPISEGSLKRKRRSSVLIKTIGSGQ